MEVVSWLDRYVRMTLRLAEAVIQACERLPALHVAQMFGLHWDTVSLLERRALQAALSRLPKAQPRRLVMDEFALFKGHRYASVVLDADTRRVLWIGEGRSRAAVRPFFNFDAIDSRGVFQFWHYARSARAAWGKLVHLTAAPVSVERIASEGFGLAFDLVLNCLAATYDIRSRYDEVFGSSGKHSDSARETL